MFKDYFRLFRNYLSLAEMRPLNFWLTFLTSVASKLTLLALPFLSAKIIDSLTRSDAPSAYGDLLAFIASFALYYLLVFLNAKIYSKNMNEVYDRLQMRILNKLTTVDDEFFTEIERGDFINTVNDYLADIGNMNDEVSEFFSSLIQAVAALVIVGLYDFWIMLLMLCFFIIYLGICYYSNRRAILYREKVIRRDNEYSTVISQVLSGHEEVKTFHILDDFQARSERIYHKYRYDFHRYRFFATLRDCDASAIDYVFQFLTYIVLISVVISGELSLGILVMVVMYEEELLGYAKEFVSSAVAVRDNELSVSSVKKILEYTPKKKTIFGSLNLDDINGSVKFNNVYLSNNRHPILRDLTFNIRPRSLVSIVGEPGSGKTMLLRLLLRLEKPTRGKILIDNQNIKDYTKNIYADNVTIVDQTPFLFNTSIRRNLDFADPDIEHQIRACKIVGLHDFIERLPNGYHTVLRQNGQNLSGGQRQLLAIARALLSRAEILLFDDVTSALDPATTAEFPRIIKRLKRDHTVIMVTKNPLLMKLSDRIIVLDHGKILDSGTHQGLKKRCKIYNSFFTQPTRLDLLKERLKDV